MRYTEEDQRRMLAEKTRLDPPPEGHEWNLGWDSENGERAPERDMLVRIAPPAAPEEDRDYGLSKATLADPETGAQWINGYDYGPTGDGVHEWLTDAVLERWAGLHPTYVMHPGDQNPETRDRAAANMCNHAQPIDVRELARLAALTVAEELRARDGRMPHGE